MIKIGQNDHTISSHVRNISVIQTSLKEIIIIIKKKKRKKESYFYHFVVVTCNGVMETVSQTEKMNNDLTTITNINIKNKPVKYILIRFICNIVISNITN